MTELFEIVSEDADLLVINKPAGLVCHPTKGDVYSSLISRVRLYLGTTGTPQLINRLDRETSGVVLIGKSQSSTLEMRRIWESRQVEKDYWAIVHGRVAEDHFTIEAPLGKDLGSAVAIKDTIRPDGAPAFTESWVLARFERAEGEFTWLKVRPHTGRKHQIRIHLASRGHSLVGDKLYGSDEKIYLSFVLGQLSEADSRRLILPCQALHAESVRFHWRSREHLFAARAEPWFLQFLPGSASSAGDLRPGRPDPPGGSQGWRYRAWQWEDGAYTERQ